MRPAARVLLALAVLSAGCMTCGPMVGSVEATTYLDARHEGNETVLRDRLVSLGFRIEGRFAADWHFVRGEGDDEQNVFVQPAYGNDSTEVRFHLRVPDREFADDDGGWRRARTYAADEAVRLQPAAQAIADALSAALGLDPRPVPPLQGSIGIC